MRRAGSCWYTSGLGKCPCAFTASLVYGRPTPANMGGLRRGFSSEVLDTCPHRAWVGADSNRTGDALCTSKAGEAGCKSIMGLSLEPVVADGTSIGEKGSLYRGRSWCRRGNEGDVGDG
jgi:hypothetical protein